MKITNGLVVAAGVLLVQSAAWATVSACSTTAGGAAISTYGAQSTSNGCAYIDKSFTDFGIGSSGFGTASTAANTNLTLAGSTLAGTSGTAFADFIGTSWDVNHGNSASATVNYVVQSHQSGDVFNGFTYTNGANGFVNPPPSDQWMINSIVADLSASRFTADDGTGVLKEGFCLGNGSLGTTGACATANGSSYGFIQITNLGNGGGYSYTCQGLGGSVVAGCNSGGFSVTSAGVVSFALATHQSTISIFDTLTLNANGGSSSHVTLHDFDNNFGEAADSPEPSTFVLFGSALGLICLGYRRRRNKS